MNLNLCNKLNPDLFNILVCMLLVGLLSSVPVGADDDRLCSEVSIHCGRTPTPVFTDEGRLLVVFVQDEFVYLASSTDNGGSFTEPVQINEQPEAVYTNGENRPKIALGRNEEIFISWTRVTEGRFNGEIRFTRSTDSGVTFEPVRTINDDGLQTGHRFDSMQVDAAGDVYLVWIDKRDREVAKKRKLAYRGAAIYSAVSRDNGLVFQANQLVAAHSCECCRIATAPAEEGTALFWRHIFDRNSRDHAFAIIGVDGQIVAPGRATTDNWQLDACPHHGPAMVPGKLNHEPEYHVTWFTNGSERQGIFYGRINLDGEDPLALQLISDAPSASHPDLLASFRDKLWIVWKEFDGVKTRIHLKLSTNEGISWGSSASIASTQNGSDHPLLISSRNVNFLSWYTEDEGYRLIPLPVNK